MSAQLRQQTLSFTQRGQIQANRPGPRSKAPTTISIAKQHTLIYSAKRRRQVGGINEAEAIEAFKRSRDHFTAGEPDSGDESSGSEGNGPPILSRKRRRAAYSREKKLQAITYITSTDIQKKGAAIGVMEPISLLYASEKLKVDRKNLRDWKNSKEKILGMKKGAYRARGPSLGREPLLESKLNKKFEEERAIGRIISSTWFIRHAKAIYRLQYPRRFSQDEITGRFEYTHFAFSNSWFKGFKDRWRITLRHKTKQAQRPPEDFRQKIENWLQFNRRNMVILPTSDCGIARIPEVPTVGRFKLSQIANMDQTPIAFEFLSGRTYDFKGASTVWIKEQRSGWDRRQATLQVCVFADGINRCKPLLIFHGHPIGDKRRIAEEKLYDCRVHTAFNKTAWADGTNLKDWVRRQYRTASPYFANENEPRFLSLDAFAPQMTQSLRDEFKKLNCTTSYIPGGCTGFIQVLDVSLNKELKALVAQQASNHADKFHNRYERGDFTISERRVLLTQWVGEAWVELHKRYQHVIIKTFRSVGLSLNPDGSEDAELKVKGLPDLQVGDYSRKEPENANGLGSLTTIDIEAIEKAQVQLAIKVTKSIAKQARQMARNQARIDSGKSYPMNEDDTAEGYDANNLINESTGLRDPVEETTDDEEEHEEVFTLGRMNTRSQTRVNRYYTHAEVEADITAARVDTEFIEEQWYELDSSNDGEDPIFDTSEDGEFDEQVGGDEDIVDENM
jgi:DDE superfamily endonuclease